MRPPTSKSRRMAATVVAAAIGALVWLALRAYQNPDFLLGFANIALCN